VIHAGFAMGMLRCANCEHRRDAGAAILHRDTLAP
jgi:hypothetical protein